MQSQTISKLIPDAFHYIANKAHLTVQQVEQKIRKCEFFDIRGEGLDLDTQFMQEVLKENEFYENPMQKHMKDDAMRFVKLMVEEWSVQIARHQIKISKDQLPNYVAKAIPFGSYVLDLKSNSSDIDLVCVCPSFIQMDTHFFGNLADKLQKCVEVVGLSKRIGATVPIITFDYKDINIDLSFCKLETQTIPRDIQRVISTQLVDSITDRKSKTALLGRKNNLMILQLSGKQIENFKQTLRVIKVWAKNRGISSNGMGFLGGISWAILLAKICQIFPNHKPNRLLYQFFKVYSMWNWKVVPVQLINMECKQQMQKKEFYMFVTTPGVLYNSTQRVNKITFRLMQEQIKRAADLLGANRQIREVCRKSEFIERYQIFLEIDICGKGQTKEDQRDYKDFQGSVQSKILILLSNIIRHAKISLQEGDLVVAPNPKLFKKNDPKFNLCYCCLIGIQLKAKQVNLGIAVRQWMNMIDKVRDGKSKLDLRLFKARRQELTDIEIQEAKKKQQIKDPRLARKMRND